MSVSEYGERYKLVASGFSQRLDLCTPKVWSATTPCEGWSVRDLVLHSAQVHLNVAGLAQDEVPLKLAEVEIASELDEGAGNSLVSTWKRGSETICEILGNEERSSKEVQTRAGTMAFDKLVGTMLCADTLVHTWDLARGAGLDETLNASVVSAIYAFMKSNDAIIRVPGGFGPKVQPPPNASEQVELLCFTGRQP